MSNEEIYIREATTENIEEVGILLDKYRVFYEQESDIVSSTQFIKERIKNGESIIFIAYNELTLPVGFVQLYPVFSSASLKRQWLLNDLYVEEQYRKNGIGKKLLLHTQNFFEDKAKGLILVTSKDNFPAKELYESVGWKTGSYDFYSYMY